jgi:hypothetical protein
VPLYHCLGGTCITYLWEICTEELINDMVVQTCSFVHQDSVDIINEGGVLTQHRDAVLVYVLEKTI